MMQIITETCRICNSKKEILVNPAQYTKWMFGEGYIQDIFPDMSPEDREMIISNTCGSCFDKLFPTSKE